jgi:xylan 1,4-beta-xylosidase
VSRDPLTARPRFSCDAEAPGEALPHFWEHTVGSGHAPLSLRADWQSQMIRAHEEAGFRHVRFHGILTGGMDTLVREGARRIYSFFNADRIVDFLLSIGMRPFVELSFMPDALASGRKTVFHYAANVTPPRDRRGWSVLVERLVSHWKKRYGRREVAQWFFEVWNEPNLDAFWTGSRLDYFRFYRQTAVTIKRVDRSFRVGGPATSQDAWIGEFVSWCRQHGAPLDFVTTHHYPTDGFGKPGDDTEIQLARSRRSVLRDRARETRRRAGGAPVYYTEWSSSSGPRDPRHDEPYAAAFAVKTMLEAAGLVEGYSWWTVSDLFAENYLPSRPFQGGFGLLTIHGVPKPVYRAFQILHEAGTERLPVAGSHPTVDAWAVRGRGSLTVILTNFALPRRPIRRETARVRVSTPAAPLSATVRRIDERHANAYRAWKRMGSPEYPDAAEIERLESASRLRPESLPWTPAGGAVDFAIDLPPQSVAAAHLRFPRGGGRP